MDYRFLLIVLLFTIFNPVFSQEGYDSLVQKASHALPKEQIKIYNQLSDKSLYNSADESFDFASKALSLSRVYGENDDIARSYLNIANALRIKGQYDAAIDSLYKTISFAHNINDKRLVANILNVIGLCHQDLNHDTLTMETFLKSMQPDQQKTIGLTSLLSNLGMLYFNTGNYNKALEFYTKYLQFSRLEGNTFKIAEALYNIGSVHEIMQNYDKALSYYKQAILHFSQDLVPDDKKCKAYYNSAKIYQMNKDYLNAIENFIKAFNNRTQSVEPEIITDIHIHLGEIFDEQERYDQSTSNYLEAHTLVCEQHDTSGIIQVSLSLGNSEKRRGNLSRAITYYNQAKTFAKKINSAELTRQSYIALSQVYQQMGKTTLALQMAYKYISISDSLGRLLELERIKEIEERYESDSKEMRIETLNKEKKIQRLLAEKKKTENKFLIVALIALLVMIVLVLRLYFIRTRTNRLLELKNQEIKQQNLKLNQVNEELQSINDQLFHSEQNLLLANATKDRMFSIISHDLRNPLISLKNLIFILKSNLDDINKEEAQEYLHQLDQNLTSAIDLMNHLLEWALTQKNALVFKTTEFNFKALLDENLSMQKNIADQKKLQFETYIEDDSKIVSDLNMVDFILRNLLNNAIKYSYPDGKIIVSFKKVNDICQLMVSDEGKGINPQLVNHLLTSDQPFTERGTADEKGTGLGLTVCKDFISKMDGVFKIESTLGKGSTFIVEFPDVK